MPALQRCLYKNISEILTISDKQHALQAPAPNVGQRRPGTAALFASTKPKPANAAAAPGTYCIQSNADLPLRHHTDYCTYVWAFCSVVTKNVNSECNVHTHIYIGIHICVNIYVYIYFHLYVYMHIYAHSHTYTHTQHAVYIYIYIYIYVHICVYKYTHTHAHKHITRSLSLSHTHTHTHSGQGWIHGEARQHQGCSSVGLCTGQAPNGHLWRR